MATYVSLINWTDQGIRNAKETLDRANAAGDLAKKFGGELKEVFWTLGQYDIVTVSEFPDEETGEAFLLAIGALGNIRTTTLRAFSAEEMVRVIKKLG